MKKYLAEFIGTFTLVFFGCGTAVVAGKNVGFLGIAFAFGFALIAMAYGIGRSSSAEWNPEPIRFRSSEYSGCRQG